MVVLEVGVMVVLEVMFRPLEVGVHGSVGGNVQTVGDKSTGCLPWND